MSLHTPEPDLAIIEGNFIFPPRVSSVLGRMTGTQWEVIPALIPVCGTVEPLVPAAPSPAAVERTGASIFDRNIKYVSSSK